jgi:predicted  nucleic acid-binding Zn-ribbon protein
LEETLSEAIKAQYQILADIRRVDEKIARLHAEAEHIPGELAKLEGALKSRRDEYERVKALFDTSEKNLRKLEQDLRAKEDSLRKAEGKMMEVKTNEEYQAAMKENEAQKADKGGLEEQVIKLSLETDGQKKHLKEAESALKDYEVSLGGDKKKLEEEKTRVMGLIRQQEETRAQFTSQLTPEVKTLYTRVASRTKGAIMIVENGMCLGCNMKIRPQLYNEVIGFKILHRCPSCGRILISVPKDSTDSGDLASK